MKVLKLILLLPLFFGATGFSQSEDILFRIIAKDSNLVIYPQKAVQSAVAVAVIDKHTHVLSLITRYGELVDAVQMADLDYLGVLNKQLSPFEYYNRFCDLMIEAAVTANRQLSSTGRIDPAWQYAGLIDELAPKVKTCKQVLEKISCIDNISSFHLYNKWLINNPDPKFFPEDSATLYTNYEEDNKGTMQSDKDTVFYYNKNIVARAYKAVLAVKDARLIFSDRDNHPLDTVVLNPATVPGMIQNKTDVFLYYRGWLESQKETVIRQILVLDSVKRRNPAYLVQFAGKKFYSIATITEALRKTAQTLLQKIGYTAFPDPRAIATITHYEYKEVQESVALLSALGIGYNITSVKGLKRYEITDHRGNVMAVVSDRKIAHTSNGTTVDYYNADVVNAADYAPFGMVTRSMQQGNQNYPFGHNGKMKDDEVKGAGNQLDYGMRIYDPRLGRFLSVDPLQKSFPWYTPYQFAGNKPIWATDLDGLEENTTSTYVYRPPLLGSKLAFNGIISITDKTTETAHKTFEGNFGQLAKADPSMLSPHIVNSLVGSNRGTEESRLNISMTSTRSEVSKSWKGTDLNYFTQYSYSFTNNNVTETGTFELKTGNVQASARAWDPATFLIVNKVVSSIIAPGKFWMSSGSTFGNDLATLKNFSNLKPKKGWFDVVIHGDGDAPGILLNINGKPIDAKGLYKMMLENGYNGTDKIRLISCNAAQGGGSSLAQELSNLSKTQVIAPAARTRVSELSKLITDDGSKYIKFNPQP